MNIRLLIDKMRWAITKNRIMDKYNVRYFQELEAGPDVRAWVVSKDFDWARIEVRKFYGPNAYKVEVLGYSEETKKAVLDFFRECAEHGFEMGW